MKLCFIGDSRSVHTQRWVRWFAARHDVCVIETAADPALEPWSISVLPTDAPQGMRLIRSAAAVRRIVSEHKPDIVHGHFINEAGWFAACAGARPVVITAWGSDLYRAPFASRIARILNPWAARRADYVTCDSADQARILRDWGVLGDSLSVVGWGVDRSEFHPQVEGASWRTRLALPARAPVVLAPRQWLPNSNIPSVIAAHALLDDDVYLILKRLPRLEADGGRAVRGAIAASPAADRIRVVDEVDDRDLPHLYAAADVVVSVCTTDGTPVSVLEAMALGCPIVALQNASLAEWVERPGGALVPSLEPEGLAAAMDGYLASNEARRLAAEANTAIVANRADRSKELARMETIYRALIARERDRDRA